MLAGILCKEEALCLFSNIDFLLSCSLLSFPSGVSEGIGGGRLWCLPGRAGLLSCWEVLQEGGAPLGRVDGGGAST